MKFFILICALLAFLAAPIFAQQSQSATAVIAAGESLSTSISLGNRTPAAIIMPATWTTAGLAFQASVDGTNYYKVKVFGSRWIETVAADDWVTITPADTWGWRYMKFESVDSSTGAASNQVAARTITLIYR